MVQLLWSLGLASLALSAAIGKNSANDIANSDGRPKGYVPRCKYQMRSSIDGSHALTLNPRQPLLPRPRRRYMLGHHLPAREYSHYRAAHVLEPRYQPGMLEPYPRTHRLRRGSQSRSPLLSHALERMSVAVRERATSHRRFRSKVRNDR